MVSATLITRLPELGTLSEVGALADDASFDRKNGRWGGETHIFGGRAKVRSAFIWWLPPPSAVPDPFTNFISACARRKEAQSGHDHLCS